MTLKRLIFTALFFATAFTSCNGQKNGSQSKSSANKEKAMSSSTALDSTGQLMKEDDFWKLIDKSRAAANNNYQGQVGSLKNILLTLDAKEIEKV